VLFLRLGVAVFLREGVAVVLLAVGVVGSTAVFLAVLAVCGVFEIPDSLRSGPPTLLRFVWAALGMAFSFLEKKKGKVG
jgi:hypothetical protein